MRAKREGYRSRAAYKLQELLTRLPRLRPGARVLELGCWPGGWLQVLAEQVGQRGRVVGVDLEPVEALGPPVACIQADLTEPDLPERLAEELGGPADLVLSDAAPKLSGIADVDRAQMQDLHAAALSICERVLAARGGLVLKAFPGPEVGDLKRRLGQRFAQVQQVRPEARRASSQEFYWVAGPGPRPARRARRSRR